MNGCLKIDDEIQLEITFREKSHLNNFTKKISRNFTQKIFLICPSHFAGKGLYYKNFWEYDKFVGTIDRNRLVIRR